MNILFIHEVDWVKKVVYEIHDFSELLSLAGHNVFAIDYEDKWNKKNFFDLGSFSTDEFKLSRAHEGAKVILRRPGMIKIPVLSRLSAFFSHYFEIKRTIENEKIDIIILYSVPTNGLQAILLAKMYNIPVMFRSIDILHQMVKYRFLKIPTYLLENIIYKKANKISTLTPKLSDYVIRMGADKQNIILLPPAIDTDRFKPLDCPILKSKLGLSEKNKIIVFIGTLFEFSGLDLFVEKFPTILKEIPHTKLVIVGGGIIYDKLEQIIDKLNLQDNVILTGFQSYDLMPQYINIADVCINPFQINDATRDVIPTKVLQYLACGKPVLATPLNGMKSILPDERCGVVYSEDVEKMVKDAIELFKDKDRLPRLGRNGYLYVRKYHDWKSMIYRSEEYIRNTIWSIQK